MSYCEWGALSDYCNDWSARKKDPKPSLRQETEEPAAYFSFLVRVMRDVAQALSHVHTHRVIHGDLKPENIFLGADGHAYLGDYGHAILSPPVHADFMQPMELFPMII